MIHIPSAPPLFRFAELLQSNQSFYGSCKDESAASYGTLLITLTVPLWTFVTFYLLALLIHYIRSIQYTILYDRCLPNHAHFRYDFHLLLGRFSANYNAYESHLIVDLLDNQMISTMTIQIPANTMFNDQQVFMFNHSRANLRSVSFTILRRHPIKDVRCIRVAHGCNNPDSRIYIHGINCRDVTNGENRFFPITSVVKYRATQWALNTTFEPKSDFSFSKIGALAYDPFSISVQPTLIELLVILFYVWSSSMFLCLVVPAKVGSNLVVHILIVVTVVGITSAFICAIHLLLIKSHVVDIHFESYSWKVINFVWITLIFFVNFALWFFTASELITNECKPNTKNWLVSSLSIASTVSLILIGLSAILLHKKCKKDAALLESHETSLMKSNSKTNLEFVVEKKPGPVDRSRYTQLAQQVGNQLGPVRLSPRKRNSKSKGSRMTKGSGGSLHKKEVKIKVSSDEPLDGPLNESGYLKTKNRNSISQYV